MIAMRWTPRGGYALELIAVAAAYYVAAQLGLQLALVDNDVTPLWPPTGVAVVALLACGYRIWPAIAVAAFAVNLPISPEAGATVLISVGNTLAPVTGVVLLRRAGFDTHLRRVRDALAIVFLGALAAMVISATVGALALLLTGGIDGDHFFETWSVWWAGDAMGVLIVAPFLWSLRPLWPLSRSQRSSRLRNLRWERAVEAALLFSALLAACLVAVRAEEHLLFLVLPLLGWIAWRFQQRGAAPAALIASVIVTATAAHDVGPFAGESLLSQMILLQSFNASVAFTSLLFASAVAERQELVAREQLTQHELYQREHRVAGTLQRSLLPDRIPDALGLEVAARYIPATRDVSVGGDWYDIIPLSEGRLGLVIGDVAGHGVSAAATMGQIRMALRAYALDELAPDQALVRLNRLMRELQPGAMATVLYGHLDPATRNFQFANAGHPPPLLIRGPHDANYVEDGRSAPVGVTQHAEFRAASLWFDPGATLVLYTDGLFERRAVSIDDRLALLRRAAGEAPDDPESVCDHLVATMLDEGPADDVALLAVRPISLVGRRLQLTGRALPETVASTRRAVGRWLTQNGVGREVAFEVMVAATEAYTNAVRHAYGVAEGTVSVDASIDGEVVTVTVSDGGVWKNARPDHDGCGLMMMRALMDSVDVYSTSGGTEVRMTRDLQLPHDHG
jgi:serine phosphatase RsbU (regulator of sigma subunit)/integral membrane sensor domain MASE1/anti-sigma regulatory factor (Ser/Thr protein kinase)